MERDLFITLDFPPSRGGVARYYDQVLKNLRGSFVVLTGTSTNNSFVAPASMLCVRKTLLGPRWLWPRWLPLLVHAFSAVKKYRPKLMHVGQVVPVGTVALILQRFLGVRYVVYTHGLDVLLLGKYRRKAALALRVFLHAERVIANSQHTKKLLLDFGVPEHRILVVLPGVAVAQPSASTIEAVRKRYAITNSLVLLSVGRLVRRKGIHDALTALSTVGEDLGQYTYFIIGDGPERAALEQQVKQLGLGQHVVFVGDVSDDELAAFYHLCTVFVLTPSSLAGTDVEGFGIVYLEAGAFGKPVIGSRSGGIPEAVLDNETGTLVAPDSPHEIAAALREMARQPDRSAAFGQRAKQLSETDWRWSKRVAVLQQWRDSFSQHTQ